MAKRLFKIFGFDSAFLVHDSWILLLFTGLGVVFVFDPLGNPRRAAAAMEPLGVRDLQSNEGTQFLSTARSLAVKVWESRLRLLCCCLPQDESHRAAFSSIAQLVGGFFSVRDCYLSLHLSCAAPYIHQFVDSCRRTRMHQEETARCADCLMASAILGVKPVVRRFWTCRLCV